MLFNLFKSTLPKKFFKLQKRTFIKIVEVGPRDGLQNEPTYVPSHVKIDLINNLSETGLLVIEATSFVSPKWVPQMQDNSEVFKNIFKKEGKSYPVLVPNVKGLLSAIAAGANEVAVFASASEDFSQKNTNCPIDEALKRIRDVVDQAKSSEIKIRGYVSCIVGCPYEGQVPPSKVAKVSEKLLSYGCYEISLGDTIGVGTKKTMNAMLNELLVVTSADKLAIHCHDTYGQALVNICMALDRGIKVVDSSVAGLGGCPYAKGATGNVATEDVVYMLHGMGEETGVDLKKLVKIGRNICNSIKKPVVSRVNNALYLKYCM